MNLSFLRYFKKDKAPEGGVAVVPRPASPVDKPASDRFGKTVMPNVSRVVGVEPEGDPATTASVPELPVAPAPRAASAPVAPTGPRKVSLGANTLAAGGPSAPAAPRKISFGANASVAIAPSTSSASHAAERTIALALADLAPHLPAGLLQTTPIDPEQRVLFKASELERGMASGRPTVLLRSIYQQAPDFFTGTVEEADEREVVLPFGKVLEQFTTFQVRPDQMNQDPVPQLETPFLKMTIEDGRRFGTPIAPSAPSVSPALEPAVAAVLSASAEPRRTAPAPAATPSAFSAPSLPPIRLTVPDGAKKSAADAPAPAPSHLETPLPRPPLAPRKISPNGMGVPATERVPASSGPPVPTPLPSPLASPPPARIPFKVSPPSNDLREPSRSGQSAPAVKAPIAFSTAGPRVRLPLRNVLREVSPFQVAGPIDQVPETAMIEIPFSIIEPQLALGRVAVSPAQFQAAIPEEFRALLKIDEDQIPIALPLQEVLKNLPNESLQLRDDQEEIVLPELFETPFSTKAAEDAARMKVSTGPIAKPSVAAAVPAASTLASAEPTLESSAPAQLAAELSTSGRHARPYTEPAPLVRTPLQVAFDTDETLDARAVVAHASRLPGVSACAIVFSDGLSLAGNIPAEYHAEALCALAPAIMKRIDEQMIGVSLGPLTGITLYCAKSPVSFFACGNICMAALHSASEIAAEIRACLSCAVRELARMYAQPA